MRARWPAGAVAALLLSTTLTACGESASSGAADPPSGPPSSATTSSTPSTSPSSPSAFDECPYLTAEQVTAAVGTPSQLTAGSVHACFFDPDGGQGPSVMLSRVDIQIDPADYARQTRQLCQGEVTDVEAGDQAFACVMGLGPQGQLYAGQVLVTVSVNDAVDDATGLADAAELLPQVRIPPPAG